MPYALIAAFTRWVLLKAFLASVSDTLRCVPLLLLLLVVLCVL